MNCLCCGSATEELIDFGAQPLVNTYAVTEKYPLIVHRCVTCRHLQLAEHIDPRILYKDYAYHSGTGQIALDYFKQFARFAVSYHPQARTVLDIACNDGSQLDAFAALGLLTYGVEPAANLAVIAEAKGHTVRPAFFEDIAFHSDTKYNIITAQNVLAHTPRPQEFLKKCASIMDGDSRLFVATSQANLIINGECDTIYHEHVSYFNVNSMMRLSTRVGLRILDIQMQDIHGTSYVFVFGKGGTPTENVVARYEWECLVGLMDQPIYDWWLRHIRNKIKRLAENVFRYRDEGYYMVGCGAAAKGISMLNMADTKLEMLFDNTEAKWHQRTSGMPIKPFREIANLSEEKVAFVVLAWNVGFEIRQNILALRNNSADVFIEAR